MDRGRIRFAAALGALVALSAGLRFWAATGVPTPWIAPDEMLYGLLGRDLWASGHLSVLGGDTPFYSLVYPALAGLPLSFANAHTGYTALKAVQAVVMSLTAVPVYLWGRTLMRPRWALVAAALSLAIPGLAYSGQVMTEAAFYPVFVLAAWAAAAVLVRPAPSRQALLLAAVALAVGTRLQALVLVPAVLTALVLKAALDRELRRPRALVPVVAVAVAALVALAVAGSSGLGGYAAAAESSYSLGPAARYVLYHAAALLLACGVVPAVAVSLLAVRAVREPDPSAHVRAFLAVCVSFCAWLVLEVGVFASVHALRIEERDLLGALPLLFLGFALWLDRGAPRTYVASAVAGIVAAAVVLLLPYGTYVNAAALPDSFTLGATLDLLAAHPGLDPALLIGLPGALLAVLVALLPRRGLPALAALLLVALVAASVASEQAIRAASSTTQAKLVGASPRWIDAAAGGPVGYVYAGGAYWNAVWANVFWNTRVDRVYDLPRHRVGGALPQTPFRLAGDGVLRDPSGEPIRHRLLVAPTNVRFAGEQLAQEPLEGFDQVGLVLWRLEGTPRLLDVVSGLQPNGDVYAHGELRSYGCTTGSYVVTLLGKTDATVELRLNGTLVRTVRTTPDEATTEIVHARPQNVSPGLCVLSIVSSNLVGITRLELARG